MLSHEETKKIFVIHKSSEGHYNKKLTMKTNKNRQNPKIKQKSARRKCRSRSKHKLFFETFMYDPSNAFSKPMQQPEIGYCVEILKGSKNMRKNI